MNRTKWNKEEDEICCKAIVDEYVIAKRNTSVEDCIKQIHANADISERDISSIRMRIQNIKGILVELDISNTLDITPLANAAMQTRACLIAYLEECKIIK